MEFLQELPVLVELFVLLFVGISGKTRSRILSFHSFVVLILIETDLFWGCGENKSDLLTSGLNSELFHRITCSHPHPDRYCDNILNSYGQYNCVLITCSCDSPGSNSTFMLCLILWVNKDIYFVNVEFSLNCHLCVCKKEEEMGSVHAFLSFHSKKPF